MKIQSQGETRMTLEEYFGKKCAESIKSLYELTLKSDAPDRETLATLLREEADKQAKDTVCITLLRIAECIESMEVSE